MKQTNKPKHVHTSFGTCDDDDGDDDDGDDGDDDDDDDDDDDGDDDDDDDDDGDGDDDDDDGGDDDDDDDDDYNNLFLGLAAGRRPALLVIFLIITDLKRVIVHSCHCIFIHFEHQQRVRARITRTSLVGFHFSVQNGTRTDRFTLPALVHKIESPLDVYRLALVLSTDTIHTHYALPTNCCLRLPSPTSYDERGRLGLYS